MMARSCGVVGTTNARARQPWEELGLGRAAGLAQSPLDVTMSGNDSGIQCKALLGGWGMKPATAAAAAGGMPGSDGI